jgi:hypothetical protein
MTSTGSPANHYHVYNDYRVSVQSVKPARQFAGRPVQVCREYSDDSDRLLRRPAGAGRRIARGGGSRRAELGDKNWEALTGYLQPLTGQAENGGDAQRQQSLNEGQGNQLRSLIRWWKAGQGDKHP